MTNMIFFEIGKVEQHHLFIYYMNILVENISFWAHAELRPVSKIVIEITLHAYLLLFRIIQIVFSDIATYSFCRHFIIGFNFGIKCDPGSTFSPNNFLICYFDNIFFSSVYWIQNLVTFQRNENYISSCNTTSKVLWNQGRESPLLAFQINGC